MRTLYVGNLYEETLAVGVTHPYIVYYYLGAKMVGERKGNYSSGNGQYRMVSDHLGSTTLTVDTASPPAVIYRAYYKPYGEVAFQSGTSLTSVGYTGQRLDGDSGLMYYGARYYDPVLSYFVSADPTTPGAGNLKDYDKYLYVRGNPLLYLDSLGYGPEDYYVFVYGCVSGPCEDPASKQFGEFEALLREEYNAWAAEAEYLNKRYGEATLPPWETWRKEHLIGVQTPDIEQGRKNLMAALAKIPSDANINLWGHSAGGGAILSYLTGGMEGYNSVDQRIASVAMIDPYLSDADATTANGLFWWSSELKDYLYANTRVKSGALLQVNVDWSIVSDYQRCIDGFSCRKADYSKSNPAGKPGPAFPVSDIFNKDYRTAWHQYSFHVVFNTNFEDWFRRYWK